MQFGPFGTYVLFQEIKKGCDFILFLVKNVAPSFDLHDKDETPEGILFVGNVGKEQRCDEVHALAIAYLWVVSGISSQNIVQSIFAAVRIKRKVFAVFPGAMNVFQNLGLLLGAPQKFGVHTLSELTLVVLHVAKQLPNFTSK